MFQILLQFGEESGSERFGIEFAVAVVVLGIRRNLRREKSVVTALCCMNRNSALYRPGFDLPTKWHRIHAHYQTTLL
jgi:hypothetical protein